MADLFDALCSPRSQQREYDRSVNMSHTSDHDDVVADLREELKKKDAQIVELSRWKEDSFSKEELLNNKST